MRAETPSVLLIYTGGTLSLIHIYPKENAEHVMLVDLARNDLSRNCHDVRVLFYKEPQY